VRTPPRILIVDDNPTNLEIFRTRLAFHGYETLTAGDGEEAIALARDQQPDLILLDIIMPKVDGIEVCRRLKCAPALPFMPIIVVTAKSDSKDVVAGLEVGADEYLTKPVDHAALLARVKSMLRIKALQDNVQEQAASLEAQARELAEWGRTLETRVADQLVQLERMSRLKRFFSPAVAEMLVSAGADRLLKSHRREISVVFCDLRGFTAFSETAEPEEVTGVLAEYHATVGPLVFQFEGTLEQFTADGLMVFFNDPLPCPDPAGRAVRMAVAMRQDVGDLIGTWRKCGYELGFGVGITMGYATLGQIGFEGRLDYTAIGTVINLASRLCDEARPGQILISQRVRLAVEEIAEAEPLGELTLKGFHGPVPAHNVVGLKGGGD
jgi:adenylate cyclase